MRRLRKTMAAALLGTLASGAAVATTFGIDQTDFWYTRDEGGWAIDVAHQGDWVHVTFYVYAADGKAVWYSGSASLTSSSGTSFVYTGDLYETAGPWFGAAVFDPNRVTYRKVGTFTFNPQDQFRGELRYNVDAATVRKSIERFTFKYNDLSGNYLVWMSGTSSGCGSPAGATADDMPVTVTHNTGDNSVRIVAGDPGDACTAVGTYVPGGRLGAVTATLTCAQAPGVTGTATWSEIEANRSGFTGKFSQSIAGCRFDGNIAGVRR